MSFKPDWHVTATVASWHLDRGARRSPVEDLGPSAAAAPKGDAPQVGTAPAAAPRAARLAVVDRVARALWAQHPWLAIADLADAVYADTAWRAEPYQGAGWARAQDYVVSYLRRERAAGQLRARRVGYGWQYGRKEPQA